MSSPDTGATILVVGPSWVGDMVMAQSLFLTIARHNPDTVIDVLAPKWSHPLLERMPQVRRGIEMPVGHGKVELGLRRRLGKKLGREGYDQAIVLPNSLKSALVPWFAGIPRRTGWLGEMRYGLINDARKLDKEGYPLMIERFCALAYPADAKLPERLPWPAFEVNADSVARAKADLEIPDSDGPILALCPGAEFGPSKRWPARHYAEVARRKLAQGWQVWLFGSASDSPVAAQIQAATENRCLDLTGRTALSQAIDLMSCAAFVVSNDSGLMHVAAALKKPLAVPYGSSSPGFTPPLAKAVAILSLDLDCSPCFQRECPLVHHNCLNQLSPDRVLDAIDRQEQVIVRS